mmetsp:Transcript_1712/g.2461  ORF Transcript_1712/g.2461 Transcript_1712/m.2461 type:complete len:224 (+) Transcript_1712:112-783(+)
MRSGIIMHLISTLVSLLVILPALALGRNGDFANTKLISSTFTSTIANTALFTFRRRKSREYTPLLFFKLPHGHMAESDRMEKIVSKIEKELNMKVERFDVLRDRMARILYEKIDEETGFNGRAPLLYHRESRQTIYGLSNVARVRAWAKGRWLPKDFEGGADLGSGRGSGVKFLPSQSDDFDEDVENGLTEEEYAMMEDEGLSELQLRGKEMIKRRMQNGGKK